MYRRSGKRSNPFDASSDPDDVLCHAKRPSFAYREPSGLGPSYSYELETTALLMTEPPHTSADVAADDERLDSEAFRAVELAVLHLLNVTLGAYAQEICNGCDVNHSSQLEHLCAMVRDDGGFYRVHYEKIMRWITMKRFVGAIQLHMRNRGLLVDDYTVKIIAQTILYQLRYEQNVFRTIDDTYGKLHPYERDLLDDLTVFYRPVE